MKAPAYQWFPKDAETDETYRLMTYEQQGIYRALLDHQWLNGSLPSDVAQLAMLVPKVSKRRFMKLWEGIEPKFDVGEDGRLRNGRLERQRLEAESFRERQSARGKRSAEKRSLGSTSVATGTQPSTVDDRLQRKSNSADCSLQSASVKHKQHAREISDLPGQFADWWRFTAYPKYRNGAGYAGNMRNDYQALQELCAVFSLERLKEMAEVFLQIPAERDKFLDSGAGRTIGKFRAYSSKLDEHLKRRATG